MKNPIFSKQILITTSIISIALSLCSCSVNVNFPNYNEDFNVNTSSSDVDLDVKEDSIDEVSYIDDESLYYIPVIETTDIHGYIVDISSGCADTYEYRLSYIAKQIDKARENGDILLLDTGDTYQGNVLSNMLWGEPLTAYMDTMKYDAVCVGNHEFDWGLDATLDHDATLGSYDLNNGLKGDSDVPIVCWNMYDKKSGKKLDYTKDYVIVDKIVKSSDGRQKDLKIAIFGYVDDYSSSIAKAKFRDFIIHEDEITDIEKKASELENEGTADISILLCHVGPEDMDALAPEDSAIDLVVCGHTHKAEVGTLSNGIAFIEGGCNGQGFASATLAISSDNHVDALDVKTNSIVSKRNLLYDNDNNRQNLDEKVLEISKSAIAEVNESYPEVTKQLGYITTDISNEKLSGSIGEDVASTWAASIMAESANAQVGVINSTGVRCEIVLKHGEAKHYVTGADIYSMFPFSNPMFKYELTYKQLLDLCENTPLNSHSYLAVSGVTAYFEDDTITSLILGDKKIYDHGWLEDKNTPVTVCVDSYITNYKDIIFNQLKPVDKFDGVPSSEMMIDYLDKAYGKDAEIPVDTNVHLVKK